LNLHRALKLLELLELLLKLLLLLNLQLLLLGLQLRLLLLLRALAEELRTELPVVRSRRQERPQLLAGRAVGARAVTRRGDRHGHWHHGHHVTARVTAWWQRRGLAQERLPRRMAEALGRLRPLLAAEVEVGIRVGLLDAWLGRRGPLGGGRHGSRHLSRGEEHGH